MSELTINITDNSRTISGYAHGSIAEELIASLSAEPETIAELEDAYRRFKNGDDWNVFDFFYDGFDPEPYDAGILIIDLAARCVAAESSYTRPSREGSVNIRADDEARFPLPYRLSEDWDFFDSIPSYEGTSIGRRRARTGCDPIDYRAVLYGEPLFEFIVSECESNRRNDGEDLIVDVHAKWLITPREDLGGKSPREAMLEKHDHITFDLHSRSLQWTFTRNCPPPISKESRAYRFAGFGTNEIVVYFDLVRSLIVGAHAGEAVDADALRSFADHWLKTENIEYSGRVPAEIVESERSRMNLTASPFECMIDEDCEICQMMAADFDTPMFWGLDGSGMELDRFEFSFFQTREEFEEDRRKFEAFNREFEQRYKMAEVFDGEIF